MPLLEFDSEVGRRVRIWLDDLPSVALLSNETTRETRVLSSGSATAVRSRVAIEIFQPFGPSFHYGLLGGEYQAVERSELEVVAPLDTPFPDRQYADSLARSLDTVTVGGLPEYATAIYAGLDRVKISDRPSGFLNLTCMAHGEIGSAPVVFTSLAGALLLALCRRDQLSSLDDVMELIAA